MSEYIDVAEIMREIRANTIPDDFSYEKTEDFTGLGFTVWLCRDENAPRNAIGNKLPNASRFPGVVRTLIRFVARCIRKAAGFIISDQIFINRNIDKSLEALSKRDDIIYSDLLQKIEKLEKENERLDKELNKLKKTL